MNAILGLKRGAVVLKQNHKEWQEAFGIEKLSLEKLLGNMAVDIQHIGSTAVPGLSAKPLLDMLLGVHSLSDDVVKIRPVLEQYGYTYREHGPDDAVRRLFMKGPDESRTHHLHVTECGSSFWKRSVAFRDWLLSHPEDVKRYEILKQELVQQYADAREFYTKGKNEFIEAVLEKCCPKT